MYPKIFFQQTIDKNITEILSFFFFFFHSKSSKMAQPFYTLSSLGIPCCPLGILCCTKLLYLLLRALCLIRLNVIV